MKKQEARKLLKAFLKNNELPIHDVIVIHIVTYEITTAWTFKGLLKIAYDL